MVQETYTFADIEKHKSKNSLWFVVHGKVYDVTKFIDEHPGNIHALLQPNFKRW
jgi:cytochrome-b5 reductase